jgi:serralysin
VVSYATPGGIITLDANLDDWHEISPFEINHYNNVTLYATTSDTHFVFALDATGGWDGVTFRYPQWPWFDAKPELWFDADLDTSTGAYLAAAPQMARPGSPPPPPYIRAEGIDLKLQFVDGVPKLFDDRGAAVDADIQYSWNANVVEFSVERSAFGESAEAMRVQAVAPEEWSSSYYSFSWPQLYFGASGDIALDGSAADWTAADRLDEPANGVDGFAVWGKATEHAYVFAIQSPIAIGKNTTIWLNTDNDASTGYQIWGWAGGAEYNVNFDWEGTPRLYGIDQVDDLAFAYSEDRTFVEIIIPKALIGAPAQVNAMLDINDLTFLPTQYAETQYEIIDPYSDFMLA